jgi:hypothetical protein
MCAVPAPRRSDRQHRATGRLPPGSKIAPSFVSPVPHCAFVRASWKTTSFWSQSAPVTADSRAGSAGQIENHAPPQAVACARLSPLLSWKGRLGHPAGEMRHATCGYLANSISTAASPPSGRPPPSFTAGKMMGVSSSLPRPHCRSDCPTSNWLPLPSSYAARWKYAWICGTPRKYHTISGPSICQVSQTLSSPTSKAPP